MVGKKRTPRARKGGGKKKERKGARKKTRARRAEKAEELGDIDFYSYQKVFKPKAEKT